MKTIVNRTHRPLRVPLAKGKVLHLGPGKTGQIADHAVEHAGVQKLLEAEEIELLGDGRHDATGAPINSPLHESTHGHAPPKTVRKRGDR